MLHNPGKFLITAALIILITGMASAQVTPVAAEKFKNTGLGMPAITGKVTVNRNGFDINAAGADIWGTKDEGLFVYLQKTGDFDIVARIESLEATNLYTKAGIMARESLEDGSRHVYFQAFPDNSQRNKNNGGFEFQYRSEKGKEMKAIYPSKAAGAPEFPVNYPNTWIRLQRKNNEFTGFASPDGKTWKAYTTFSLDLPAGVYLGLAVTSHDVNKTTVAKFRDISEIR
jgi:hypothetical protein